MLWCQSWAPVAHNMAWKLRVLLSVLQVIFESAMLTASAPSPRSLRIAYSYKPPWKMLLTKSVPSFSPHQSAIMFFIQAAKFSTLTKKSSLLEGHWKPFSMESGGSRSDPFCIDLRKNKSVAEWQHQFLERCAVRSMKINQYITLKMVSWKEVS